MKSQYPQALLADGEVFAIVRNRSELEAASDNAARYGVKLSTRPATKEEARAVAGVWGTP